ncbi:MAG: hypothetical protein CFH33_01232 [Alphaproteobacteria bacterium MarineAlpha9_Bin3]|nr:MAG: hypothetical protein CFH33_01232 [Alphaproteobacteria bacterium MarineAlpha9_Bin3]|tara:strand:- start:7863 stop:8237 length:375 start_codon:yes stop_codon:yes gene_type:complete
MIKVLLIFLYLLSVNINLTAYADDSPTKNDIVDIFKRSMNHWKINYDNLDENKSGAACIPWQTIDKTFIKEGIFTALGYGFNLYDIKIAKKAALEGCERMRRANNIMNTCKCEMVLYNNDILLE